MSNLSGIRKMHTHTLSFSLPRTFIADCFPLTFAEVRHVQANEVATLSLIIFNEVLTRNECIHAVFALHICSTFA